MNIKQILKLSVGVLTGEWPNVLSFYVMNLVCVKVSTMVIEAIRLPVCVGSYYACVRVWVYVDFVVFFYYFNAWFTAVNFLRVILRGSVDVKIYSPWKRLYRTC